MNRLYVDSNNARFKRRGLTTVDMELYDGTVIENLEPRRLFPISAQTRYISLLDSDLNEKGLIRKVFTTNAVCTTPELMAREWYCSVDLSKYISYIVDT